MGRLLSYKGDLIFIIDVSDHSHSNEEEGMDFEDSMLTFTEFEEPESNDICSHPGTYMHTY